MSWVPRTSNSQGLAAFALRGQARMANNIRMNWVRVYTENLEELDARTGSPAIDSAARVRAFDVDLRFDIGQQTFEKICSSPSAS